MARLVGGIGLLALLAFGSGLGDGPFVDEYAYITQSYYSDLFFQGHRNDPAWLDDFAIDLQPLPKYFIGPALHAARLPMPDWRVALRWYRDAHTRFGPPPTLTVARIPFIATGVLGGIALLGCGLLIGGRTVGAIAAFLLIINPLFRLHAHRAMSDVPCESFLIAALGLALWGFSRIGSGRGLVAGLTLFAAAGVCSGLAIVCKLNGLLAPMVVAAWCGLATLAPRWSLRRKLAMAIGTIVSMVMMVTTMITLNPTLTCHPGIRIDHPGLAARAGEGPLGRFLEMVRYRIESAAGQRKMSKFAEYIVRTPADKVAVLAVQGFGRFGPLGPSESDSTVRYDLRQDWGLVLWGPLIVFGMYRAARSGWRQLREGEPPTALALLVWAALSWAVVAAYLPLAWDRYLLPIQAPNALLAAVGLAALRDWWGRKAVSP